MTQEPPPRNYAALREMLALAGRHALEQRGLHSVEFKADGSAVTEVDRSCEQLLRRSLAERFPGEAISGEEFGGEFGAGVCWFIDPLDGTHSYLEGLSYWGPTIARVDEEGISHGALYLPRLDQFWYAERGQGAWCDGRRLPLLSESSLPPVMYIPSGFHRYATSRFPGRCRNLGSTASHLALVASGAAQLALIAGSWGPWDVCAGLLMLEEVGGQALSLQGQPLPRRPLQSVTFVAGEIGACREVLTPGYFKVERQHER